MVGTERQRFRVPPDSVLSSLLEDAAATGEPLLLDAGTAVYVVGVSAAGEDGGERESDVVNRRPSAEQVQRSIEGIRKAAGSWKGLVDADAFKEYIRKRRKTANRPSVQL